MIELSDSEKDEPEDGCIEMEWDMYVESEQGGIPARSLNEQQSSRSVVLL